MNRTQTQTHRKLDRVYRESLTLPFQVQRDRIVIFSDLHMADKVAKVDEFVRNELIYAHALQEYDRNGFRLILNGDVEECWETKPRLIREAYRDTAYAMERRFADKGPAWHVRIVGNHDDLWTNREKVEKYLWPALGPVKVHVGARLGDHILITHGHQGDWFSDTAAVLSRHAVRHGWRGLQRLLNMTTARAARNHMIRKRRDDALYSWARSRGKILIAGHTHRSMFGEMPESNQIVEMLRKLEKELPTHPTPFQLRATIEHLRKLAQSTTFTGSFGDALPCYFNSGCGVHTDGITGIEIEGGKIRLVKWLMDDAQDEDALVVQQQLLFKIERKVYREAELSALIEQVRKGSAPNRVDPETGHFELKEKGNKGEVDSAA